MDQKIVKIGMMSFAHMHARSYALCINELPNVELAGLADDDSARGKAMSAELKAHYFASYQDLLASDIDAVVIGSENVKHRKLVEMAAAAGKHVLCEKPLATTLEDCHAIIDACKKNGVKLMTAFPIRFAPPIADLKHFVESGRMGRILSINGTNRGQNPGGWFTDKSLSGGGAVIDHTVHVVDLMRWLTGAEVTEVYAEIDNLISRKDCDDMAALTFTFSDGSFGSLDPSWSRPKTFPYWGDLTMEVVGDSGVVSIDVYAQSIDLYSDKDMRHSHQHWGGDADLALVKSFTDAVANGTPVPVSGEDGMAAVEVALAAYESAKRQEPVELPLTSPNPLPQGGGTQDSLP